MRSDDGSITDLGDGRLRVRVTVGYDPLTGKQVRVSRTVRGTRKDARDMRDRLKREYGAAASVSYAKMSVYTFVKDEWLPTRKLRATTLAGYTATLENHIRPAFGTVKIRDLKPMHITRVLTAMDNQGAALNVYKMLKSALNYAVDNDILASNPVKKVPKPELEEYEADVYSLEEVVKLLFEVIRDSPIEAGVIIAATCGPRVSEICALDWLDLHLERVTDAEGVTHYRGTVTIDDGYHRLKGQRITTPTKNKRSKRTVALPGFAVKRLLEIRGIGPLMVDSTGQRMAPGGFTSRWRRLLKPRFSADGRRIYEPPMRYIELKNLRHSRATILLALGATIQDVSLTLGHANQRTTDAFYNKPSRAADHAVASLLDEAVERLQRDTA